MQSALTDPASNSYVSEKVDFPLHVHSNNLKLQHFQPSHTKNYQVNDFAQAEHQLKKLHCT